MKKIRHGYFYHAPSRRCVKTPILIVFFIYMYHSFQVICPHILNTQELECFAKLLRMCLGYVSLFVY